MTEPRVCPECGGLMSRQARRCRHCSLRASGRKRWARHRARLCFERFLEGSTVYFTPPEGMGRQQFARAVERAVRSVFE